MHRFIPCCLVLLLLAGAPALAQEGGSTIIPKREVNEVLLRGLDNLAGGGAVSDIVVRHLDVGEENMGVSVVQRSKVEYGTPSPVLPIRTLTRSTTSSPVPAPW